MPTVTKPPPRSPLPEPPKNFDLEALIKEARRRQRRRQALFVAVAVAVAVLIWIIVHGVAGGSAASGGRADGLGGAGAAAAATAFAVGVVPEDAKTHLFVPGGGLAIVRPQTRSCTRVPLPMFGGDISFSGRRYVYPEVDARDIGRVPPVLREGVVGRGQPRRARIHLRPFVLPGYTRSSSGWTVTPIWVDGHVGLLESNVPRRAPRLHFAGRTIVLPVPRDAKFGAVSASRNRFLYGVSWSNIWGTGDARSATLVYARGVSKIVRRSRGASPGGDTWSPDGSRIAFIDRGDLWTMRADGSGARRLTHTRKVETTEGPLLWSPDGKAIAYTHWNKLGSNVYLVRTGTGRPTQLTQAQPPSAAPNAAAGYQALTWVGTTAIAVSYSSSAEPGESVGVVDASTGAWSPMCTLPVAAITNATALR
jgi:WD40-like Beta Propeller Repeat